MSSISWTSTVSGNWNTGSNWSGGAVPGAADDVTINTSHAITVTYSSGADSVLSLSTGANDTLRFTNGDLTVNGNAALNGTVAQSGGTLVLAGGQAAMNGGLRQSGGTVDIASGFLDIAGTASTLNGTLTGGTLILSAGTDRIGAGAALGVAGLELTGAQVNLGENLAQAGIFDMTAGTLAAGGHTLTLSGDSGLTGGAIGGSGSIILGGSSEVGNFTFAGSERVTNTGVLDQTGTAAFGYAAADSVSFTNAAAGTWRIDGAQMVAGNANAALVNQGDFIVAAGPGTALADDSLASTGTVTVQSGILQILGARDSFAGTVNGAGGLELSGGAVALAAGLKLSVATVDIDGAAVTLGGRLAYGGAYEQSGGTLALGRFTAALSGPVTLNAGAVRGSGTMSVANATVYGYAVEGSATLANSGTLTINGNIYDGAMSGDAAHIANSGTASVLVLADDATIYGTGGSALTNAGTIDKTSGAGTSSIAVSLTSTGTLEIDSGTLMLSGAANAISGTVSGLGTLELNSGTDTLGGAGGLALAMGGMLLDGATVTLANPVNYAGNLWQTGGTLALGSTTLMLSGHAALSGGTITATGTLANSGTLTVDGPAAMDGGTVQNSGTMDLDGGWSLYETTLDNLAGGTLMISSQSLGVSLIENAGLMVASGSGTMLLSSELMTTGTLTVSAGWLDISGRTNVIGGTLNGPGGVTLDYGAVLIAAGTVLAVGSLTMGTARVSFEGNEAYGGVFNGVGTSVDLGNNVLTLSGQAQFSGGFFGSVGTGSLVLAGQTDITGGFSAEGSMAVINTGTITDTSSWYLGYNSTDTAWLQNSGTLAMGGVEIYGQAGDAIVNAGTIAKSLGGGIGIIQPQLTNDGTVSVSQGGLSFLGAVSGSGQFIAGAGTELYFSAASSGGTVMLGASSELSVNAAAGFGETIGGFAAGNVIDLAGLSYTGTSTSFAFNAEKDQLTVSNGSASITLQFTGAYGRGSFAVFNDQGIVGIHHT